MNIGRHTSTASKSYMERLNYLQRKRLFRMIEIKRNFKWYKWYENKDKVKSAIVDKKRGKNASINLNWIVPVFSSQCSVFIVIIALCLLLLTLLFCSCCIIIDKQLHAIFYIFINKNEHETGILMQKENRKCAHNVALFILFAHWYRPANSPIETKTIHSHHATILHLGIKWHTQFYFM